MCDKRRGVYLAFFDQTEYLGAIAPVHATGLEGQVFSVHIGQGKHLGAVVESHHGDDGIGACTLPRQTEGVVGSCHLEHDVGSAMIATPQHNLPAILRLHHLYVRIMFTHKAYSFRRFLANNDAAGVLEHHAKQGADSGRAGADDEHRILFGNLRYAGRPKARGKHVAHKERLFVSHRIRNAVQSLVGIRHADVLGLTSVDAATQCPTTIGIGAIVHISVSAKEAFATKGFYVHRNPVAGPDGSDVRAHLLHDAYHFVPHRGSGQGTRHATVLDVQIAGADAAERHADNGVAGVFQPGFRFFYKFKFSVFNIGICKHCFSLF